jgi:hypothetical protein
MRKLALLVAVGLVAAAAVLTTTMGGPVTSGSAASHRDAPLIMQDPVADNTDVYAFVSTETGRQDYVTLIANFIPLEEPGEGPNYYRFGDDVVYELMVDVNGDAREDLTYQFDFQTKIGAVTPNTFLYNTGTIGLPPNPANPTSQYTNLNQPTSYTLKEVQGNRNGGKSSLLLRNARVAPINVGPNSIDDYEALADAAVHSVGKGSSNMRVFVGPRDEGFYVDLMGNFDLLNLRNPGVDTASGFNVHTIALEVPKSEFVKVGDTDGVIGVWSAASRQRLEVLRGDGFPSITAGDSVQVSRLGNPLVNEVLIPLKAKDKFNATQPKNDGANFSNFIVNPGNSQGPAALIPLLNGVTGCTPTNGRMDLDLALLKGIPAGVLGLPGNQDTQRAGGPVTADLLRLNYKVPPATDAYSPLGAFGGDVAGFPNGRRVGDDVLDVAARAAAGGVLHLLGAINCPASLGVSDNVQANDVPYLDHFPYLGLPHEGFNHNHDHGSSPMAAVSMGLGAAGLLIGLSLAAGRFVPRLRRSR